MAKIATVNDFFENVAFSKEECALLRILVLQTELIEKLKWNAPTYTLNEKNIVGIGAFKSYAGLWFFQGATLSDPNQLLLNAQQGKTIAMRQMRFTDLSEIKEDIILPYILEAIQNQKNGNIIAARSNKPLKIPKDLKRVMKTDQDLEAAFNLLTSGKKREFI
ncbi:DUF1801 domain-containing protein [Flavobacteriaceae bacterium M23B6Z8]